MGGTFPHWFLGMNGLPARWGIPYNQDPFRPSHEGKKLITKTNFPRWPENGL